MHTLMQVEKFKTTSRFLPTTMDTRACYALLFAFVQCLLCFASRYCTIVESNICHSPLPNPIGAPSIQYNTVQHSPTCSKNGTAS